MVLKPYILAFGEMVHNTIQLVLENTAGVRTEAATYVKALFEWVRFLIQQSLTHTIKMVKLRGSF